MTDAAVRAKVVTVGGIFSFDILCILVFGVALGWI